ncbi:MAG: MgtC/SapB family protein [Acidobacteriota bacterium]
MKPLVEFPPLEVATNLLVALGIGLLVGLEREWAHKDMGVRSFAIVTLLGMLAALLSANFVLAALAGVIVLIIIVNAGNLYNNRPIEVTTAGAVLVVYALGVLVGEGHVFTPTAAAIVMTLLLAMKPDFLRFAGGLSAPEVRGTILLGLVGFVVYPIFCPIGSWIRGLC